VPLPPGYESNNPYPIVRMIARAVRDHCLVVGEQIAERWSGPVSRRKAFYFALTAFGFCHSVASYGWRGPTILNLLTFGAAAATLYGAVGGFMNDWNPNIPQRFSLSA
jgi:hypothetical protein